MFDDLLTFALVILCLYAFLPRVIRQALHIGFTPSMGALVEHIRYGLSKLERAAYWLIVGRPYPQKVLIVSEQEGEPMPLPTPAPNLTECDERAERTNEPSVRPLFLAAERLEVDRTRSAMIAVLLEAGWETTYIRSVLKGTSAELGKEIAAARRHLAEGAEVLIIRENGQERVIAKYGEEQPV